MREREIPVAFQPLGKRVHVLEGSRLAEAAAGAGLAIDMPCGGEGICGKCRVVLRQGAKPPGPADRQHFSADELAQGWRLACQCCVTAASTVEVPETSVLASFHKILAHGESDWQEAPDPEVRKQYVELTPPRRGDDAPDLVRLHRAIGPTAVGLDVARRLPGLLREAGFRGTAVVAGGELIGFEPGDTRAESFGVAFDIGTTTIVAMLVELATGRERGVVSRLNPQTGFGDDVITRIQLILDDPQGLDRLHRAVVDAADEMIGELVAEAGVPRERVYRVAVAGNTTMQQLFARIDPRCLAEVPFAPAVGRGLEFRAAEIGLRVHPFARAYVLPVIGGFVGGDTVGGILATRMAELPGPSLLIDIGTNGEIVLCHEGRMLAAATAAGPAFEGARISGGMRAARGAIEKVTVDGRLRIGVIGDAPPVGLCGSALIDLGAEMLRFGLMSVEGRMRPPDALPAELPDDLRRRVVMHEQFPALVLASADESGTGRPILFTQRDVRQLQLASGAIRAGIVVLLKRLELQAEQLENVLLAGGFGNFIRRKNAQRMGLLPPEIPRQRIRYQGNTSLAGARLAAISGEARRKAEELAAGTEHVDLSSTGRSPTR